VIFTATPLPGAWILELDRHEDQRGFFARSWCAREAEARGLNPRVVQCSVSVNKRRGTLRGMHYQMAPYQEAKLIRCTRGAIHDVILDLRRGSPAFKRHVVVQLDAEGGRMLYVPEGVAHGFQTLTDDAEVFYQMSEFYAPDHARGVRWDDPAFGITWPADDRTISERDRGYADFGV
jgi:dTDP-4-dehydrorhamnose 3,5-epimerase